MIAPLSIGRLPVVCPGAMPRPIHDALAGELVRSCDGAGCKAAAGASSCRHPTKRSRSGLIVFYLRFAFPGFGFPGLGVAHDGVQRRATRPTARRWRSLSLKRGLLQLAASPARSASVAASGLSFAVRCALGGQSKMRCRKAAHGGPASGCFHLWASGRSAIPRPAVSLPLSCGPP